MMHFGTRQIERHIIFKDEACRITSLSDGYDAVIPLFGASFGLFPKKNSVLISYRPSYHYCDKMDIFSTIWDENRSDYEYAGHVDANKKYIFQLLFGCESNKYNIRIYPENQLRPIVNFSSYYEYPIWNFGFIQQKVHSKNIIIQKT